MRNTFIDTIISAARIRDDVFIVSGDAGLGVFDEFSAGLPQKFLNLGVAEQNAAGFCAGMSLAGFKVYLYNIIPFLLYRCYEQVRNDICYQKLPVVLTGIGSGVTYAPQGMTHYSVEDIGIAQTLPNLRVFSPADPVEARLCARYSLTAKEPVYVRLAKRGEPAIHTETEFDICRPKEILKGGRIAVVAHGSVTIEAVRAGRILQAGDAAPSTHAPALAGGICSGCRPEGTKESGAPGLPGGLHIRVISVPCVQPLDAASLFDMVGDADHVIVVEEHYVSCGLGSIITREWMKKRPGWQLHLLGISADFIHEIKDTAGMREHFGISAAKIADFIRSIQ